MLYSSIQDYSAADLETLTQTLPNIETLLRLSSAFVRLAKKLSSEELEKIKWKVLKVCVTRQSQSPKLLLVNLFKWISDEQRIMGRLYSELRLF